jgi:hypothetical protein
LQSIAPSQGSSIQFGTGSVGLPSISFIGDSNTGIYSPAADTLAFVEGGTEVARFDSSGNFGVGTSSPNRKLTVAGNSAQLFDTNGVLFFGTSTGGYGDNTAIGRASTSGFHIADSAVGDLCIGAEVGKGILFGTNTSGSLAPRMKIEASGQQVSCIPNFSNSTLYPEFKCRAWVNFNGTTSPGTIRASGNVSSVTRNGTGDFTVNFSTAIGDANYAANITHNEEFFFAQAVGDFTYATGSFRFGTFEQQNGRINPSAVNVTIFR